VTATTLETSEDRLVSESAADSVAHPTLHRTQTTLYVANALTGKIFAQKLPLCHLGPVWNLSGYVTRVSR